MSVRDRLQELRAQRTKLRAELREESKQGFKEMAAELFEAHPKLRSFSWKQYTDYFNDGEPCHFHAHTDYPDVNGHDPDSGRGDNWSDETISVVVGHRQRSETIQYGWQQGQIRTWQEPIYEERPNPAYDPELVAAHEDVCEFLRGFETDDFEEMFGDHVQITVTRDGVEIEEYTSHD